MISHAGDALNELYLTGCTRTSAMHVPDEGLQGDGGGLLLCVLTASSELLKEAR